MAYNNKNHLKRVRYIIDIYKLVKEIDKPDTFILRVVFPKYHIHISYRTWMVYKNMKASEFQNTTPTLFDNPS